MAYQKSIVYNQDPLMEQYYIYNINTDLQRLLLNIDITMLESSDALMATSLGWKDTSKCCSDVPLRCNYRLN